MPSDLSPRFAVESPVVDTLFGDLAVWADTPRWAGSGFTRLVVELADLRGHPARAVARKHKAILEDQLAAVLDRAQVPEPKARAREIWLLSEGAITLMLVHGDHAYAAAAAAAAKRLLASPAQQRSALWTHDDATTNSQRLR